MIAPLAKRPDYDMIIRQHSDDFIKNRLKVEQRDEEQTLKRWEEEKRTSSNNIGNGGGDGDGKGDSNCGDDDHENKVQTHPLYSLNAKQDAVRKIEENECNPSSSSSNDEDAENVYDVVIMGAAYAGLCMAAAARKEGLKYLLVEKNTEGVGKVKKRASDSVSYAWRLVYIPELHALAQLNRLLCEHTYLPAYLHR